jgi:hypothetical protein
MVLEEVPPVHVSEPGVCGIGGAVCPGSRWTETQAPALEAGDATL